MNFVCWGGCDEEMKRNDSFGVLKRGDLMCLMKFDFLHIKTIKAKLLLLFQNELMLIKSVITHFWLSKYTK